MSSVPSEGLRRLSGLAVVLAAVAAQSFVTRGVGAEQAQPPTYGVQLLEQDLAEPVPPIRHPHLGLTPVVAEPDGFAATLLDVALEPPKKARF